MLLQKSRLSSLRLALQTPFITQSANKDVFPELNAIEDALRAGVVRAWTIAIEENVIDDLRTV